MNVNILAFGITKEILGSRSLNLDLPLDNGATVEDLREYLFEKYPELKKLNSLGIAQGTVYAQDDDRLNPAEEIALIPPVSGG
ncbi:MAG: MoaD/ThiS family protein [Bacteroidetes bacterium]|nr:MoaD/ThiS family protein [Bacteroidota bacterium]